VRVYVIHFFDRVGVDCYVLTCARGGEDITTLRRRLDLGRGVPLGRHPSDGPLLRDTAERRPQPAAMVRSHRGAPEDEGGAGGHEPDGQHGAVLHQPSVGIKTRGI
jgi:hypothetical protein